MCDSYVLVASRSQDVTIVAYTSVTASWVESPVSFQLLWNTCMMLESHVGCGGRLLFRGTSVCGGASNYADENQCGPLSQAAAKGNI